MCPPRRRTKACAESDINESEFVIPAVPSVFRHTFLAWTLLITGQVVVRRPTVREPLLELQPLDELERKAKKAVRLKGNLWTQEELDVVRRNPDVWSAAFFDKGARVKA